MSQDVVIGYVHPGQVAAGFHDSFLRMIGHDARHGGSRIAGWLGVQSSANISSARNAVVEWFLDSDAQWLVQIDTDMVWDADAVHRLIETANPADAPILGALCFGYESDTGLIFPTLYDIGGTQDAIEFLRLRKFPAVDRLKVAATGAAFLAVHRTVFEQMRKRAFSAAYPYFQEREIGGKKAGEDITFCLRAASLGIPVHVNTNIHIGHIKSTLVTADAYGMQLAMLDRQEASNG